jgi:hypothetical protein
VRDEGVIVTARRDGAPVEVAVASEGLRIDGQLWDWTTLDRFEPAGYAVRLGTCDGAEVTLTHFAQALDGFVRTASEARARARRAALLQWTGGAAVASFDGKRGDERVVVHLFPDGLTVEPLNGLPDFVPLSCLEDVDRRGYEIDLHVRALGVVRIRHLGQRTDELLDRLQRARTALAQRADAAYATLDPRLAGLPAPDGWAVDEQAAGARWGPLTEAVAGHARAGEVAVLASIAGPALRLGVKTGPGSAVLPFALAPVRGRVAVEGTDSDARATFVFSTEDVDRLNLVLLLTSFRRDALHLPEDRLGRWALAVRTLEVVRWARAALVARVVHDGRWEEQVRAALA